MRHVWWVGDFLRLFCISFLSFPFNMSLNAYAPAWMPTVAKNSTIAELVALVNSTSVCGEHYGWWGSMARPAFPTCNLSDEDALLAVQQHPGILEMLPESQRTYEVVLAAMRSAPKEAIERYNSNGENFPLLHVPLVHRDETVCLAAAAWCNRALWFWPMPLRTKEMYLKAMRLNPSCIDTMPEPFCNDPEIQALAPPKPIFHFDF